MALVIVGAVVALAAVALCRRPRDPRFVSVAWLAEQRRTADTVGRDGPSWNWPAIQRAAADHADLTRG